MFRNILKSVLCAAAVVTSVAQAAPLTGNETGGFDAIDAATYRTFLGANGLSIDGVRFAGVHAGGARILDPATEVIPMARIFMPMARISMGLVPMGYGPTRRTFSGIVLTPPARGQPYVPDLGGANVASSNGFSLPAFHFGGYGGARLTGRHGRSGGLNLNYNAALSEIGNNWSYSRQNQGAYRDISDVFVERDVSDSYLENGGNGGAERRMDSCFEASRTSGAGGTDGHQGFGDRLASLPSALIGAIQQFGEYLACFM